MIQLFNWFRDFLYDLRFFFGLDGSVLHTHSREQATESGNRAERIETNVLL